MERVNSVFARNGNGVIGNKLSPTNDIANVTTSLLFVAKGEGRPHAVVRSNGNNNFYTVQNLNHVAVAHFLGDGISGKVGILNDAGFYVFVELDRECFVHRSRACVCNSHNNGTCNQQNDRQQKQYGFENRGFHLFFHFGTPPFIES